MTNGGKLTTDWYEKMFQLIDERKHFVYELQIELAEYCGNGIENITKK